VATSLSPPDPHKIADQLPLASPRLMEDMGEPSLEDILTISPNSALADLKNNPYLQEALKYSYDTAPTTKPIMDSFTTTRRSC
jgi:hypothetical protein